jgi:hypothetical protein
MAARLLVRSLSVTAFSLSIGSGVLALIPAHAVRADEAASSTDVENAKRSFIGKVNSTSAFILSGPRDDAYQTQKINQGTEVTVTGIKADWLRIVPPAGSFAYVPKVYVDRHGDGSVGRATREITARVGSDLVPTKLQPMAKVEEGDEVQIIGEAEEYFKIQPPKGSVLWVNKQLVDPVRPAAPEVNPLRIADTAGIKPPQPDGAEQNPASPATQPAGIELAAGPTTKPAGPTAAATADQFDKLEAEYAAADEKPITDQPVAELKNGYESLLKSDSLADSMRRIAEVRVATLKMRYDAKQEYVAFKEVEDKNAERRKSVIAEGDEIKDRMAKHAVTVYATVGTLRTSSIQHAGSMLYRITDPETGRTIAYLRTTGSTPLSLLGQFVGVKGDITDDSDMNVKMIDNPKTVEAVDQTKINSSIAAEILPPSLFSRASEASTNTPEN